VVVGVGDRGRVLLHDGMEYRPGSAWPACCVAAARDHHIFDCCNVIEESGMNIVAIALIAFGAGVTLTALALGDMGRDRRVVRMRGKYLVKRREW